MHCNALVCQAVVLSLLALTCCMTAAEDTPAPGPKLGTKAAEFKLPDQNGKERKLSELLKQGPVAVVFHRSADW